MVASRRYVDLLNPRPEDVDLDDLARGLAQPRYRCQTQSPITVADHSLRCARFGLVCEETAEVILALLLHDVAEAYLGDMPGPLKPYVRATLRSGALVDWRELESLWTDAICAALLPPVMATRVAELIDEKRGTVARYDHMALRVEAQLWMPGAADWACESKISTSDAVVEALDPRIWQAAILHGGDEPDPSLCWHAAVDTICGVFRDNAREFRDASQTNVGRSGVYREAIDCARTYLGVTP